MQAVAALVSQEMQRAPLAPTLPVQGLAVVTPALGPVRVLAVLSVLAALPAAAAAAASPAAALVDALPWSTRASRWE
jgi:hypothetical protein